MTEAAPRGMLFIGVSTGRSSIMRVFPRWAELLGLGADLEGVDLPLHAPAADYRAVVARIAADPAIAGALVTSHKLDLYAAAADLFAELDDFARLTAEVSSISKRPDGGLVGRAKDPISAGLALAAFVPPGHWRRSGGNVLCLGAGGAAVAITFHLARAEDRPERVLVVDLDPERLAHIRALHEKLGSDVAFAYHLHREPERNDALLAELPPGSLVINATGMGKDRPGSPLTGRAVFPEDGLVWDLNYRGDLDFLAQARRQRERRNLHIEDGWTYFLHGWTQVVAEVFGLTLSPELFEALGRAAAAAR